jgi:serine/threonine protein kinase/Tfp pilus assembly protein PilF
VNPRRWEKIRAAFDEVVELEAAERVTRLAEIGAVDAPLRDAVHSLLSADADADSRLAPIESPFVSPDAAPEQANSTSHTPDLFGLSGRAVSHFQVREPLGAGGMGVVYRAEDVRLGRPVALKFLLPQYSLDSAAKGRFLHEARSAAALDHPNICTVHEAGESEDGRLFLAMSCYSGETLKARLAREGALPIEQAIEIATQIARGLGCAHEAGIVHRDLKPANLMLTPDGTVRILDFGLAKARDLSLTASGLGMGTVAYMSPEQLQGEPVDARTDLWSLGVVLFEMLTGHHPFQGDYATAILTRHVQVARARTVQPEVPEALAEVVERLLRKDAAKRYQNANELLADLDALRVAAGTSARTSQRSRSRLVPRAWRTWHAVAALVLVVSLPTVVVLWSRATSRRNARPVAISEMQGRLPSVAVLPLKNYSGDPAQDYFADGMTDELTTTLAKIGALRVIAHQSVLQFKRSSQSVPEIARLLNVKHVVDGSVLQDGDRVRITATLIDAARNTPIWTESFERERRGVMALQREVALAIARAIEIALTPQDLARLKDTAAVDPEAFDLYVKGTQARYKGLENQDIAEALRYFGRAVAKDSTYAPAYAGLASAYVFSGDEARARRFVEKALALDATLAEAHVVRGLIRQIYRWDWAGSEESFRQAIRLNPGFAEAHHELSMLLMRRRRFDEALHEAQRTLYLAPMSSRFEHGIAQIHLMSGRYDEALHGSDKVLALDPTRTDAYWLKALAYAQQRRYDKAEAAWSKVLALGGDGDAVRAGLGHIYAVSGRRVEALRILDTLRNRWAERKGQVTSYGTAMGIAEIYTGLGDRERALDWLERAAAPGAFMLYLAIEPQLLPLHGEPRFQALLRKVGLAD